MLPKVLIVEDDAVIREIYALKLGLEGYTVREAANGAAALAVLDEFTPDIILLDMMMPVMSGLEFMQTVQPRQVPAEIIVFSNVPASEQRQAVLDLGAVDYWVKSDYTPELVLESIMKRWRARQA